jgi:hypothetical protein
VISRDDSDSSETLASRCWSQKGVVSNDAAVTAVGIAPIRRTPASPSCIAERSSRRASRSARMRRAHITTRSPSGVNPSNRRPRRTIVTLSSLSNFRMPADSDGWETWQASAARAKWRSCANAIRYSN